MLNRLVRQVRRRKVLIVCMIAIALMSGLLFAKYRMYAQAVAWHCVHGNYAEVGGHKVKLSILWQKERAHAHETSDMRDHDEWLARACPSNKLDEKPEIDVSPAIPGEVENTQLEELKLTQSVISTLSHNSAKGWSHSLVTLTPRPFTVYCIRDDLTIFGDDVLSRLTCYTAKLPYRFIYDGPPTREKEAESILSSLE